MLIRRGNIVATPHLYYYITTPPTEGPVIQTTPLESQEETKTTEASPENTLEENEE
jgi:hypothetical protein